MRLWKECGGDGYVIGGIEISGRNVDLEGESREAKRSKVQFERPSCEGVMRNDKIFASQCLTAPIRPVK